MPPQEGVKLNESFIEALQRCLEIECGIDVPPDPKQLARHMHIRSCRFVDIVPLPLDRHGERPVADDAPGTALESVTLRRKAYWMATVILRSQADIAPAADGKEITELRWFSFDEARRRIRETNHPEKAELLLRAVSMCSQDISGGPSPQTGRKVSG